MIGQIDRKAVNQIGDHFVDYFRVPQHRLLHGRQDFACKLLRVDKLELIVGAEYLYLVRLVPDADKRLRVALNQHVLHRY